MKVKVIKKFVDKHTKKVHKVDEIFECSEARLSEIQKAGSFVEPVLPEKKETKKDTE